MATTAVPDNDTVLVEVVSDTGDFPEVYRCISEAFGRQVHDAIWIAFNPDWETPDGQAAGAERMARRWKSATTDNRGNPNAIYLKVTLPDPHQSGRRITVGFAVWVQVSSVEGYGAENSGELSDAVAEALHPGNESEQRFVQQMFRSLLRARVEYVNSKASEENPAVMCLDLCATHPAFQRRGIASKLVQWGLDEAHRRGIASATIEASSMGRHVYRRLGFRPQGSDLVYEVDDEFSDREKPPNVFMVYSRDAE
ncbi:acyl-CoA N-acyltransferase [Xylaria digitata]|nr:acyl-CoA N-acyltransferase [Xylaria digitata]